MSVKLLNKHDFEFLSLKTDCTGLSESTLVKMPHCWKSHVTAHMSYLVHKKVSQHRQLCDCGNQLIEERAGCFAYCILA